MDGPSYIEITTKHLKAANGLQGLFLGGSHGKNSADSVSDVDFVGVADPANHSAIADHWRKGLEAAEPVVLWRARLGAHSLINVITQSWVRLDLILTPLDAFGERVQFGLKPLHDPSDLYAKLKERAPNYEPSPQRVAYMIEEFFRILGMSPVVLARGEMVTMALGTSLLRDLVRDLMLENCPLADRGGAMHLSSLISADDMVVLEALPYPGPDRDALIEAQIEIAAVFLPRARAMAKHLDIDWPDALEAATKAHLDATHGIKISG